MKTVHVTDSRLPKSAATALAVTALAVPALTSLRDNPSERNPEIQRWYEGLRKPSFNPPQRVFPLVWTALQSMLALGAYRLAREPASRERTRALALWGANVAMISTWSKLFFGHRMLGAGTVAAAAMVGTGAAYVVAARPLDKPAAASGVPYTAWVAFAALLSAAIWKLNQRP